MKKRCKAYVGARNTGKTTKLYQYYLQMYQNKRNIMVVDSATEHEDKSLIVRLKKERKDAIWIPSCEVKAICYPDISDTMYPKMNITQETMLYLCDVSFFLEKGYDYPPGATREYYRNLYKRLSMQLVVALLDRVDSILFDEIECIAQSRLVLEHIAEKNKTLLMTLHSLDSIQDMQDIIDVERVF